MTGHPLWLVSRREIIERVRARSFLVSTLIYLVVALASVIVPNVVGDRETVYRVGLTGAPTADLERAIDRLAEGAELDVRTTRLSDATAAAAAVRDRRVHVAVVDGTRLLVRDDVPEELAPLVNTAAFQVQLGRRLGQLGLSPAEAAPLLDLDQLVVEEVQEARPARASNRPLAYAGVLVIYLLLLTYGFAVANGVLEEKSSRVAEVLLGALRPTQLLAGKVVGIGVVAVFQLLITAVPAGLVALALGSLDLPSGTPLTMLAVVLWSLLGYGLYSCVFAAAGAAASRPEDVGNATAPITIFIALTYFVAMAAVQEPDGTLARVASFIPFMTPMTMLPRAAVGHVAAWEVPLGIAIVLVTTYATVRLGARIYAGGIRRPGPRLKLREAWRAAAV
ncbi:MAG: ABC transporter permease [Actinomycetota bacterium]|nr:ABC transporter permease [Actinomycetota bacterium]